MALYPQALWTDAGLNTDIVTVRAATRADFITILNLFEEIDRRHRERLPDIFQAPRGDPRERSYIDTLIRDPNSGVLVAEIQGQVVGLLILETHRSADYPILVPLTYAVVNTLVVAESARQKGVGSALMASAETWTRARGMDRVELNVFEFNTDAIRFYEGLGYTTLSRRMLKRL